MKKKQDHNLIEFTFGAAVLGLFSYLILAVIIACIFVFG
jgi:hypothetical protein